MKSSTKMSLVLRAVDLLGGFPYSFSYSFSLPFLSSNSQALKFKIVSKGLIFHFTKPFPFIRFYNERV